MHDVCSVGITMMEGDNDQGDVCFSDSRRNLASNHRGLRLAAVTACLTPYRFDLDLPPYIMLLDDTFIFVQTFQRLLIYPIVGEILEHVRVCGVSVTRCFFTAILRSPSIIDIYHPHHHHHHYHQHRSSHHTS